MGSTGPRAREALHGRGAPNLATKRARRPKLANCEEFVFGSENAPFTVTQTIVRANDAWKTAKLERVTLHECRHTFASLMIAAGVNAKALSTYMGHATIGITLDRYGHLMPGNEDESAGMLDAYLARADTAARLAQIDR